MRAYAQTDSGKVRKVNQDSVFASVDPVGPLSNLFMVADGMGGHKAGDYASRFVVETMVRLLKESGKKEAVSVLREAVEETNRLLFEEASRDTERTGMGSTLVAATILNGTLYVANVGDSRLYLLQDRLEQITRDHSLVEEMAALGKIRRDSEAYKNQKNIITRAMGIAATVDADLFEIPVRENDCILLCSDGLTNMVEDGEIETILRTPATLEEKTGALIKAANDNGGRDNIAVILAEPQTSEVIVC